MNEFANLREQLDSIIEEIKSLIMQEAFAESTVRIQQANEALMKLTELADGEIQKRVVSNRESELESLKLSQHPKVELVYHIQKCYFGSIKNNKSWNKISEVEVLVPFLGKRYSSPNSLTRLSDYSSDVLSKLYRSFVKEKRITFPDTKFESSLEKKYSSKSRNNILYLRTLIDGENATHFKDGIVSIGKSPIEKQEFDYLLRSVGINVYQFGSCCNNVVVGKKHWDDLKIQIFHGHSDKVNVYSQEMVIDILKRGQKAINDTEKIAAQRESHPALKWYYENELLISRQIMKYRPDILPLPETKKLNWILLPPGKWRMEDVIKYYKEYEGKTSDARVDYERIRILSQLKPISCYQGQEGWYGYIVFIFKDATKVVLDCPIEGNAIYILQGDFLEMTKHSKRFLLEHYSNKVDKVVHKGNWFDRVKSKIHLTP